MLLKNYSRCGLFALFTDVFFGDDFDGRIDGFCFDFIQLQFDAVWLAIQWAVIAFDGKDGTQEFTSFPTFSTPGKLQDVWVMPGTSEQSLGGRPPTERMAANINHC